MSLYSLGIADTVSVLGRGEQSAQALVNEYLARIDEFEPTVQAWAYLDRSFAMEQARMRDEARTRGKPTGPLHGVPIGIKDIVDTAYWPTEYGCQVFSGRVAKTDAWLVERLRQAGAIILGKTVTAEMATYAPGKTTNPHNAEHTPGGSSSGSAAAVASFMAAGAIGSQTNGSMIRPASFCGVYGFKPSHGLIPRHGVLRQSLFLDQMGVFARSVADLALLAEVIIGHHPDDPHTSPIQTPSPLSRICNEEPPAPPKFALVRTAAWDKADTVTRQGLEQVAEALGDRAEEIELPASFSEVWDWQRVVNEADIALNYGSYFEDHMDKISDSLAGQITRGMEISMVDYHRATEKRLLLNTLLDELFDVYDALIAPAAIGEAPKSLASTGNPVFCTPWTFTGVPAVCLPLLQGENGLPVGVQLVGQKNDDGRLLRSALWLDKFLGQ